VKRVLYVDHTAALGGAEIALLRLLQHLDRDRWDPLVVLGEEGRLASQLMAMRVPRRIHHLPLRLADLRQDTIKPRSLANPTRVASAVRYVVELARLIRSERADLVHTNSLRASVVGAFAARVAGVPVIWQIHSVVGKPMMSAAGVALMRVLARLPQHVICNSQTTAAALRMPAERTTVIPCGLPTEEALPPLVGEGQAIYPPPPAGEGRVGARRPTRVGMVSRFHFIKGQHVFLDAIGKVAETHPSAEFVIAGAALFGEQGYEAEIKAHAMASPAAARIQLPGFIDNVPQLLRDLDIVVAPSVAPEGFGQVVAEAMMAARPVVASSAGGPSEILEDGVTGRLVKPGDAGALAQAIGDLLDDPGEARAMGRRGRDIALERYDIRKTARAIEGVYGRVLARR